MLQLYHALVHLLILYDIIILKRVKTLQNQAIKIPGRYHYRDGAESYYRQFKTLKIDDLWKYEIAKFVHNTIYSRNPSLLRNYFLQSTEHFNQVTRQIY